MGLSKPSARITSLTCERQITDPTTARHVSWILVAAAIGTCEILAAAPPSLAVCALGVAALRQVQHEVCGVKIICPTH